MRDPKRIDDFCDKLKEVWKNVPDWRFGQLMSNALSEIESRTGQDIFYTEDDTMIAELERLFKERK